MFTKFAMKLETAKKLVAAIKAKGIKLTRTADDLSVEELHSVRGYYSPHSNSIYVKKGPFSLEVLAHEFGHEQDLQNILNNATSSLDRDAKLDYYLKNYLRSPIIRREYEQTANNLARHWLKNNSSNYKADIADFIKSPANTVDSDLLGNIYLHELKNKQRYTPKRYIDLFKKHKDNEEIQTAVLNHLVNKEKMQNKGIFATNAFGDFDNTPIINTF